MFKRYFSLTLLAALACLVCAGCGAASKPKPKISDAQLNPILTQNYKTVVAFAPAQLQASIAATQKHLAPCVAKLAPAVQAQKTAGLLLSHELELQYTVAVEHPIFASEEAMAVQLSHLPWSASLKTGLVREASSLRQALSLNTCADLNSWKTHDYTEKSLPAGTGFVAVQVADKQSLFPTITVGHSSSPALKKLGMTAAQSLKSDAQTTQSSLVSWLKKVA